MLNFLIALRRDDHGVSALEYAILAGLIVVAVGVAVKTLDFSGIFSGLNDAVTAASTPPAATN